MTAWSFVLQERHLRELKTALGEAAQSGQPEIVSLLCGKADIAADPWNGTAHTKLLSQAFTGRIQNDLLEEATPRAAEAEKMGLVLALAISLSESLKTGIFEALAEAMPQLPMLILSPEETPCLTGQLLRDRGNTPRLISVVGSGISLHYPERGLGEPVEVFNRQALAFGETLTQDMSQLRIGIVGCGATGSAVAMLLPRLGVGRVLLADNDVVEESNLNRLHGARRVDALEKRAKVEVLQRAIEEMGLGTQVIGLRKLANEQDTLEALKACDLIFGCTDDNHGRLVLNRFAYFYLTPVIDMGLAIEVSKTVPGELQALDGRVTVLGVSHTCLLCWGVIETQRAHAEALRRASPDEYARRKEEAYVIGEKNPSPAVVTFTTEVAAMAVNEMLHRFTGFKGPDGGFQQMTRFFHQRRDSRQEVHPREGCRICSSQGYWGRGDVEPLLDMVN